MYILPWLCFFASSEAWNPCILTDYSFSLKDARILHPLLHERFRSRHSSQRRRMPGDGDRSSEVRLLLSFFLPFHSPISQSRRIDLFVQSGSEWVNRCEEMMQSSCIDRFDSLGCEAAKSFCDVHLQGYFLGANINVSQSSSCSSCLLYPSLAAWSCSSSHSN
jgi:hypothetical protein